MTAGTTREAIDAAHREAVENGEASEDDVRQVPGQQDFDGGEVKPQQFKQKDGGERVETFPEEIRVDGTTQLSAFDAGGKHPTTSTMTVSGKVVSDKAWSKGEVLPIKGYVVVREVKQKDKVDKQTGIVVDCGQTHVGQIVDLEITA